MRGLWCREICANAIRWLKPTSRSTQQIVDQIITKQLTVTLGVQQRNWVMRHQPKSLESTIKLLESYNAAGEAGSALSGTTTEKGKAQGKPGTTGSYTECQLPVEMLESNKPKADKGGVLSMKTSKPSALG
ncbi:hypothetical protein JRQ81_006984, partial [Phrynocephalus forsythii]